MIGHLSSLSIRVFDKELMLHNKRSTRAVAPAERKGLISNTLNPYQDARHMNFSRMDFSPLSNPLSDSYASSHASVQVG